MSYKKLAAILCVIINDKPISLEESHVCILLLNNLNQIFHSDWKDNSLLKSRLNSIFCIFSMQAGRVANHSKQFNLILKLCSFVSDGNYNEFNKLALSHIVGSGGVYVNESDDDSDDDSAGLYRNRI